MNIQEQCTVDLEIDSVWNFIQDVSAVARCVPGVEKVEAVDPSTYAGILSVKLGPLTARFSGTATVQEMDRPSGRASMAVRGQDSRVASQVHGTIRLQVTEVEKGRTTLSVLADLSVLGVMGQLGHWVIKKKAGDLMRDFARELTSEAWRHS